MFQLPSEIFKTCDELLGNYFLHHTPRQANKVAHPLAYNAFEETYDVYMDSFYFDISKLVLMDPLVFFVFYGWTY